jgi:thioredoxin-like negative regulator of GroEL
MTDDNDLVKRLRNAATKRDGFDAVYLSPEAADRIEALETKLAKAVEAIQEAIKLAEMPHYGDREAALDNCFDAINLLRAAVAELKGDKP